jgi:hypothetical protein
MLLSLGQNFDYIDNQLVFGKQEKSVIAGSDDLPLVEVKVLSS